MSLRRTYWGAMRGLTLAGVIVLGVAAAMLLRRPELPPSKVVIPDRMEPVRMAGREEALPASPVQPVPPQRGQPRTLVMAAAIGYPLGLFELFIYPLRAVYSGDVVIFVQHPPDNVKALCAKLNVRLEELEKKSALGPKGDRYIAYRRVCSDYDACLATDFRDAYFQADPFPPAKLPKEYGADLVFALEHSRKTIGTCKINSDWIRSCWGDEVLAPMKDKPIICSGTIMGTPRGFEALEKAMLDELAISREKKGCRARDQGHVNYLAYNGKIPVPVAMPKSGDAVFNTIGYYTTDMINEMVDKHGKIVNTDGSTSPLVHQYDRYPKVVALFKAGMKQAKDRLG